LTIRGEHLAQLGKHDDALKNFVDLPRRGSPLFRDGLSYATERLKLYTEAKSRILAPDMIDRAKDVLKWFASTVTYVNFSEAILTVRGLTPSPGVTSTGTVELPLEFAPRGFTSSASNRQSKAKAAKPAHTTPEEKDVDNEGLSELLISRR
jgi:hypothetical protein